MPDEERPLTDKIKAALDKIEHHADFLENHKHQFTPNQQPHIQTIQYCIEELQTRVYPHVEMLLKQMEAESVFHTLSGEWITPLDGIRGVTAMFLRGEAGTLEDEQRTHLEAIRQATDKLWTWSLNK